MKDNVIETHPAIWVLYRASDGERSMAYDGARIRCGRADCEGFTDELECPQGCGVRIESNQAERDAQYHREMAEREAERKAWRASLRDDRSIAPRTKLPPPSGMKQVEVGFGPRVQKIPVLLRSWWRNPKAQHRAYRA